MVGAGIDAGHALLIGLLFTCLIDLAGQMGDAEQVNIFKAVSFPELCFFGQHIFGGFCIKIHLRRQRLLVLFTHANVKIAAVDIAQTLYCFFPCHGSTVLSLNTAITFPYAFTVLSAKGAVRKKLHFSSPETLSLLEKSQSILYASCF